MAAHAEESSTRGFTVRVPRRDAMLVAGALLLGGGGTFGGLNFFGAKADAQPIVRDAIDLADLKAEIAGMHADVRALMSNQAELREDVRELRRIMNTRGSR